jgi:regulator of nonsense transcripts 2
LRTSINAASVASSLQEIKTLSLQKYLSEIISACNEGLGKLKTAPEIAAGVEITSALHQRFGPAQFTEKLGFLLARGLATPDKALLKGLTPEAREKEEKERYSRQRVLIRVTTELWLVGVLRTVEDIQNPDDGTKPKDGAPGKADPLGRTRIGQGDAEPFPIEVLKELLGRDRDHSQLPLVVLFVKSFAEDVLGSQPKATRDRKAIDEDGNPTVTDDEIGSQNGTETTQVSSIVSPELQSRFRNILSKYFEDVKTHLVKDQKQMNTQAKKNAEAYVKSGEIFEDRQANYEKQVKTLDKLITNAQVLADALDLDMPTLSTEDPASALSGANIGLVNASDYLRAEGDSVGIWEDEEEKRFYEGIIDIAERVPAILLEDGKKKKPEDAAEAQADTTAKEAPADAVPAAEKQTDDTSTAIANKTVGAQVDGLIARLPELTSRDAVDQLAIDFCFLNSKASRNRLVKALQEVPRGRVDLLPTWSRLVATLGKHMPDVPQGLITHLDSDFRHLQRRKEKEGFTNVKKISIRYLAELIKFGVVPEHTVFHLLKVGMDDFSKLNIEIICDMLENCGRYLYRSPETAPRMQSFLDTLQRKKTTQHIGQQERMLIENALYYVNPPERPAIQQKERPPIEQFIRHLIYIDLSKRTYTKTLKQIRKLHWEEKPVLEMLDKIFTKPWKVKFSNIHLLAILLGSLYRYHRAFVIGVVDDILEQITVGLEHNNFKHNQRRIAQVKYLGELYNYKMVDSPVIFDTLYRIVTFGHCKF